MHCIHYIYILCVCFKQMMMKMMIFHLESKFVKIHNIINSWNLDTLITAKCDPLKIVWNVHCPWYYRTMEELLNNDLWHPMCFVGGTYPQMKTNHSHFFVNFSNDIGVAQVSAIELRPSKMSLNSPKMKI